MPGVRRNKPLSWSACTLYDAADVLLMPHAAQMSRSVGA
jgi:hypothetical protein